MHVKKARTKAFIMQRQYFEASVGDGTKPIEIEVEIE